ncbi:MAG TPA: ABC transporter ATP-binding protein [bacterium]|nr:ABC transporter ATP-binding protein [bacterium]
MAQVRLEHLRKTYGKVTAIDDVSLTVEDGEFLVLLGPSGCGKTTVLRAVAGLEELDRGGITIGGRDVTGLPPGRRRIAMVFQSYAVFPHLRVYDNIVFGLRMARVPGDEQRRRAQDAAGLLQIQDLLDRYPAQLSGGQRQRVAVARAIVMRPDVLLMDEPLSNLDALLRLHMRTELKRIHRELGVTTIYVTHDQVEALSLGQRIAVMYGGRIVQHDTPSRVYDAPANRLVGAFMGNPPMNFLEGRARAAGGRAALVVSGRSLELPDRAAAWLAAHAADPVLAGIRPEHIAVSLREEPGTLAAVVVAVEPLGAQSLLTAAVGEQALKVSVSVDFHADPGQPVWVRVDGSRVRLMDARTGDAIPV